MSSITPDILETAKSQTKGLLLGQLKLVARAAQLPVSGPKAVLQTRINDRLSYLAERNDFHDFYRLKAVISNPENPPKLDPGGLAQPYHQAPKMGPSVGATSTLHGIPANARLNFKESPFYIIQRQLTHVQELKVRESTRDQVECSIRIPPDVAAMFAQSENLKIMVYCAPEPLSPYNKVDISFPNQIEIKVNKNEVKANLRGLKQRPGSTRPADITDLVHKRVSYENILTITYALTTKKYSLVVNLVEQVTAEKLVAKLKSRRPISKQQVIKEMMNNAQDSDIQATSSILSLTCPISTLRIAVPCRSASCTHNQCYDALSYFQLQEQAPTWICPSCNKSAPFDTIQIDQYVEDILVATSTTTEQVAIEPNGMWTEISATQDYEARSNSSDGDDIIEIQGLPRMSNIKNEAMSGSELIRTPPRASRDELTMPITQKPGSGKRPAAVIDLTLSDDDDDDAPRPSKRLAHDYSNAEPLSNQQQETDSPNSMPNFSFINSGQNSQPGGSVSY